MQNVCRKNDSRRRLHKLHIPCLPLTLPMDPLLLLEFFDQIFTSDAGQLTSNKANTLLSQRGRILRLIGVFTLHWTAIYERISGPPIPRKHKGDSGSQSTGWEVTFTISLLNINTEGERFK